MDARTTVPFAGVMLVAVSLGLSPLAAALPNWEWVAHWVFDASGAVTDSGIDNAPQHWVTCTGTWNEVLNFTIPSLDGSWHREGRADTSQMILEEKDWKAGQLTTVQTQCSAGQQVELSCTWGSCGGPGPADDSQCAMNSVVYNTCNFQCWGAYSHISVDVTGFFIKPAVVGNGQAICADNTLAECIAVLGTCHDDTQCGGVGACGSPGTCKITGVIVHVACDAY